MSMIETIYLAVTMLLYSFAAAVSIKCFYKGEWPVVRKPFERRTIAVALVIELALAGTAALLFFRP